MKFILNNQSLNQRLAEVRPDYGKLREAVSALQKSGEEAEPMAREYVFITVWSYCDHVFHGYEESNMELDRDFLVEKFWATNAWQKLDTTDEESLKNSLNAICQNLRKGAYHKRNGKRKCDATSSACQPLSEIEWKTGMSEDHMSFLGCRDSDCGWHKVYQMLEEMYPDPRVVDLRNNDDKVKMFFDVYAAAGGKEMLLETIMAIDHYFEAKTCSGRPTKQWLKALLCALPQELKESLEEEVKRRLPEGGSESLRRLMKRYRFLATSDGRTHHLRKNR